MVHVAATLETPERASRTFIEATRRMLAANLNALVGAVLFIGVVLVAIFAQLIAPHDPNFQEPADRLLAPGAERPSDPAEHLPRVLSELMRDIDIPNGIGAVGFGEGDIGALVDGAMKQQRLLATCPRDVTEDDLAGIFSRSLELW